MRRACVQFLMEYDDGPVSDSEQDFRLMPTQNSGMSGMFTLKSQGGVFYSGPRKFGYKFDDCVYDGHSDDIDEYPERYDHGVCRPCPCDEPYDHCANACSEPYVCSDEDKPCAGKDAL